MDDYISRKALIEHIKAHCGGCDNCGEVMHCAWDTPAADVKGVKWQDGSYMRTTRHSAAIAECGCRLQDTGVGRAPMRGTSPITAHPAVRK